MADRHRQVALRYLFFGLFLLLVGSGIFLVGIFPADASHTCNTSAVCYNWPSPRVWVTWAGGCTSMEKGGTTGTPHTWAPYANSLNTLFWNDWSGCAGTFCQPAYPGSNWALNDLYVIPGWSYIYRMKVTPWHSGTASWVTIDSCTCGGGCPPADNSQFISSNIPIEVAPGQPFVGTVAFKNTGTSFWSISPALYRTVTSLANAARWSMSQVVDVIGTVAPNGTQTFIFSGTAPAVAGNYSMDSWRMDNSGVRFGQNSTPQNVLVNTRATGGLVVNECSGLIGWARDADTPGSALAVRFYQDGPMGIGALAGTVIANNFYAGVPFLDQNHGFNWIPPKDASPHQYWVYAQDVQTAVWHQLANSPRVPITCYNTPSVTFAATPTSVPYNGASTLSWSVSNPIGVACTGSNGSASWPGAKATAGSQGSGPLSTSTTFTLTCTNAAGSTIENVLVTVATPPAPTVTIPDPGGDQFCGTGPGGIITWNHTESGGQPITFYQLQVYGDPGVSSASLLYDSLQQVYLGGCCSGSAVAQGGGISPGVRLHARVKVWDASTVSAWSNILTFFHPPRASFMIDPSPPIQDQPFTATDTTNYGAALPGSRAWDMGDTTIYNPGATPQSHTYTASGDRTITMTATDANGRSCDAIQVITVNKRIPGFREVLPK